MATISFSGLASGIDTDALIKATSDATRARDVTPSQTKVTDLEDTDTKFQELRTKLTSFRTLVTDYSSLSGGAVVKTVDAADETILTATAGNGAINGSYSLTVTQRARNGTHSWDDRFASSGTVIAPATINGNPAADRTVSYAIGSGSELETIDVVMTSTTTASDFVNQFNAVATKAQASLINVGTSTTPSYAIVITSNNEGTEKGAIVVSKGADIASLGIFAVPTQSIARNAQFSVSGISGTIERSSNTVNDVLAGVTLSLNTTGTSIITIRDDVEATKENIRGIVTQWNEIVAFIAENNTVQREQDGKQVQNIFGALAKTTVDDNIMSALRTTLASSTASSGSTVRIFADLGIATQRDGTLLLTEATFDTAMASESASVNNLLKTFADEMSRTGGTIDTYTRFNGLIDSTVNANKAVVANLNDRIARSEAKIAEAEQNMRSRFSRLEAQISRLNSQQGALSSALAGLK